MFKRKKTEKTEVVVFEATVFCGGPPTNNPTTNDSVNNALNRTPNGEFMDYEMYEDSEDNAMCGDEDFKPMKTGPSRKKPFAFNKKSSGVRATYVDKLTSDKPYDFFRNFIDDKFLQKMVDATNSYAHMCKENNQMVNSWIQPWRDTTVEEMRKFIGVVIWMGLVKYPTMNSYWCRNRLYSNSVVNSISRSQFQLLSNMWRLGPESDQSADMISPLLSDLRKKFKQMLVAPEVFSIEKVFIPSDSETEGMNIHFLHVKGGYIYNFDVHNGSRLRNISTDNALRLIDDVLDKGRIMVANEDLTTMKFAKLLLDRKTYLIGLLNPNSSHIPQKLRDKRLLGDQTESFTSEDGIVIRKYNPFSEQYLLTTRSTNTINDYYKYRTATSSSHELKITNQVLMNSMNWYQKYAVEIIINTCLINACYLYRKIRTKKISSIRFMEDIISGLLDLPANAGPCQLSLEKLGVDEEIFATDHKLQKVQRSRRCGGCYERYCREFGRKVAMNRASKTPYECTACKRVFCVDCFFKYHTARMRNIKDVIVGKQEEVVSQT